MRADRVCTAAHEWHAAAVTSIPSRARRLATSSTSTATLTRLLTTISAPLENPSSTAVLLCYESTLLSTLGGLLLRFQVRAGARAALCGRRMRARDRPEGNRGGRHKVCRENDGCARERALRRASVCARARAVWAPKDCAYTQSIGGGARSTVIKQTSFGARTKQCFTVVARRTPTRGARWHGFGCARRHRDRL
jgi:hypothetical protein